MGRIVAPPSWIQEIRERRRLGFRRPAHRPCGVLHLGLPSRDCQDELSSDSIASDPRAPALALIFAAVMAATAISGFCPLYLLPGRLSKRRKLA